MEIDAWLFINNHLHNIAELISLAIAIFYYPYLKDSFAKWFLPFLTIIFIGELIITYQHLYDNNQFNINIYYLIGISESIFYNYIFYKFSDNKSLKKTIVYCTFLGALIYCSGFLFYQDNNNYHINCVIISGFLLSSISLGYIYTKFINDDKETIILEPGFWIVAGVSLFFSGISIVFSLHDLIVEKDLTLFGIRLYKFVPRVLCIVLYTCISIAIILCKKKIKILL